MACGPGSARSFHARGWTVVEGIVCPSSLDCFCTHQVRALLACWELQDLGPQILDKKAGTRHIVVKALRGARRSASVSAVSR